MATETKETKRRLKLTAGGAKYVAECVRYKCPSCNRNFLIHPTRWALHIEECIQRLTPQVRLMIYRDEENPQTREILGELILRQENVESPN